jgi:hypothetical protein
VSDNWGYVTAGYVITAAAIGGYVVLLWQRLRRAERAQRDDLDA